MSSRSRGSKGSATPSLRRWSGLSTASSLPLQQAASSSSRPEQPLLSNGYSRQGICEKFCVFLAHSRLPEPQAAPQDPFDSRCESHEERSFLGGLVKVWTAASQALMGVASEAGQTDKSSCRQDFQQWFQERFQEPTPNFCKAHLRCASCKADLERLVGLLWGCGAASLGRAALADGLVSSGASAHCSELIIGRKRMRPLRSSAERSCRTRWCYSRFRR